MNVFCDTLTLYAFYSIPPNVLIVIYVIAFAACP